MKQLIILFVFILFHSNIFAQPILGTTYSYSNVGNEFTFYLSSYFSFGSGEGPKVKWIQTMVSNDTVFIKAIYDHRGHWPTFYSGSNDTINYNNISSGINFFNVSTNYLTEFGMDPTEVDTFWNVYDTTFNLNASRINEHSVFNGILIYPNPSNGNVEIVKYSKTSNQLKAVIFDMLGRVILQHPVVLSNNHAHIKIDVPQGNYIIELKDETGTTHRQRILIQ